MARNTGAEGSRLPPRLVYAQRMKPHFRLLALRSSTFHYIELSERLMVSNPELSPCTFEVMPLSGLYALAEISQCAAHADGMLLFYDEVQTPNPIIEGALWISHQAGLPLLALVPSASREDAATLHTQQMKEYLAAPGYPSDELPVLARQPFLFARPPGEWRAALEDAAQQSSLRRWSERRHKELRAIVLQTEKNKTKLGIIQGDIHSEMTVLASASGEPLTISRCADLEPIEEHIQASNFSAHTFRLRSIWCHITAGKSPPLLSSLTENPTNEMNRRIVLYVESSTNKKTKNTTRITLHRYIPKTLRPHETVASLASLPQSPIGSILEANIQFASVGIASCWLARDCFQWSHRGMNGVGVVLS
jgi:hypothetical protein